MAEIYYGLRIKLAVDIDRQFLAGGGELHFDCEQALLNYGCLQKNIWGADWYPTTREVEFESIINLRASQGNNSTVLQDSDIREQVEAITRKLLEIA